MSYDEFLLKAVISLKFCTLNVHFRHQNAAILYANAHWHLPAVEKKCYPFRFPALEGVANRALMASALHYYNLFKINIMNKTALKSESRNYNLKKINNFTETQKNNTKNTKK